MPDAHARLESRIALFMIEFLSKTYGEFHIENIPVNHQLMSRIKFDVTLVNDFLNPNYFSPTEKYYALIKNLAAKYFHTEEVDYNNTGSIFYIKDWSL